MSDNLRQLRGSTPPSGEGGDPHMNAMSERLTRLEARFEGIKQMLDLTVLSVGAIGAVLIALTIYALIRIDSVADRVNKIPSEISADLRDLTKTLAESITAAKQQPPQ